MVLRYGTIAAPWCRGMVSHHYGATTVPLELSYYDATMRLRRYATVPTAPWYRATAALLRRYDGAAGRTQCGAWLLLAMPWGCMGVLEYIGRGQMLQELYDTNTDSL